MFLILFKRVCLGEWKLGQRRKKCAIVSVPLPQSHNGFIVSWKQCLNLWSQRWLNPGRNLIRSLIPYELRILKILFAQGRIKFRSLFLKSVQIRSFFWSVFGHFLRSVRGFPSFYFSSQVCSTQILQKERMSSWNNCVLHELQEYYCYVSFHALC